jgi:DNA-binding beta-propeller fold protein YncE
MPKQQFAVDSEQKYYFRASSSINEYNNVGFVQQFNLSRQPGLSWPQAVAVDSQGNVYAADTSNNRIVKFTASAYAQLVTMGSNPQLYAPQALQVFNGSLYAMDANGRLLQFAVSNAQQTAVIIDTGGALVSPVSLAIDSAGRFYIADAFLQRVTQHSSSGQLLAVLTNSSSPITQPSSVAVDSVNSLLYIVDETDQEQPVRHSDPNCAACASPASS